MNVNFNKLKVEVEIDNYQELNVAKSLANTLFKTCSTLDEDVLIRKIYHSNSDVELSENEMSILNAMMERAGVLFSVKKAISNYSTKKE